MPSKEVLVAIVEDSSLFRIAERDILEAVVGPDVHIVFEATTVDGALGGIPVFQKAEGDVHKILLLDDNLTSGVRGGEEGRTVANAYRNQVPGVLVFSLSAEGSSVGYADRSFPKARTTALMDMADAIAAL